MKDPQFGQDIPGKTGLSKDELICLSDLLLMPFRRRNVQVRCTGAGRKGSLKFGIGRKLLKNPEFPSLSLRTVFPTCV